MDIGIGIDGSLGLSLQDQGQVSGEAARLGYSSVWTPEGPGIDSFHLCQLRWAATADVVDGGLTTGISVSPVSLRGPVALAMSAGTLSRITGGRFLLGIGVGGLYQEETRRAFGVPEVSPVRLMREYLETVRGLLAGEVVTYEGRAVNLRGVQLAFDSPPRTPRIPRSSWAPDAEIGRTACRWRRTQLVHAGADCLEQGKGCRGRGESRP